MTHFDIEINTYTYIPKKKSFIASNGWLKTQLCGSQETVDVIARRIGRVIGRMTRDNISATTTFALKWN